MIQNNYNLKYQKESKEKYTLKMKALPSKKHYCYKIHTLLMKTKTDLSPFYKQPHVKITPLIFTKTSWAPTPILSWFFQKSTSPINKGGYIMLREGVGVGGSRCDLHCVLKFLSNFRFVFQLNYSYITIYWKKKLKLYFFVLRKMSNYINFKINTTYYSQFTIHFSTYRTWFSLNHKHMFSLNK